MKIKNLTKLFGSRLGRSAPLNPSAPDVYHYKPTPYLAHAFLQSVYNISEPLFPFKFKREQIFFKDGGHISLDWLPPASENPTPPILFVMHGLTGGSEMNYIKELMRPAAEEGYCCVCLNSRGVNNEMTSPIPFTAIQFEELETALERVSQYYPNSEIYMVGTSFGGNYLMRYLMRQPLRFNIKGLVALAPPINVNRVVSDMGSVYQKFFVKRYIEDTVCRHQQMQHWEDIGLVDMKKVKASQNLMEFHTHLTAKILGMPSAREVFEKYTIGES
jgi:predicted alpha/beta-fold hydrolase